MIANEGGRGGLHGPATRRVLGAMIVVEVTLAIALVAGAGRLLLSMQNLLAIDPGFTAEGRLAIDVLLPPRPYADPARLAAWSDEAERGSAPLARHRSAWRRRCRSRHEWDSTAFVDITNRPTEPANRPNGRVRIVSPGFFDVFEIRIVAGRSFTVDDRADGAPVVVVNRAWARKFIPDLDPLRERVNPGRFVIRVDQAIGDPRTRRSSGSSRMFRIRTLTKAAEPTVYVADGAGADVAAKHRHHRG